ncbi:expressed unknown protein [Seminavis robusta]|uniref:Uncharacterized protein n=1 Tax=Seminavis robusta TaxID=568900 RepID=A0A9N8EDT3_9STRA|nr:expressed unknown protein [Seminavis robusta]|eukprot:Sro1030_g233370.1 n/a (2026) ;mRNA; r:19738-25895
MPPSPSWPPGTYVCYQTCVKPQYSLRRQLLLSFGATGVITTSLVILMACLCVLSTGRVVQENARAFISREVISSISNSSQYAAESFSQELDHLRGTVSLIVEIVRDRIVGYPNDGWENDTHVPFRNLQGQQKYPLKSPLLPRDWMVTPNIHWNNYQEHVQELFDLLQKQHMAPSHGKPMLSTESAAFVFPGNCDPTVTDTNHPAYYPNCTQANNNAQTGGVVKPTRTLKGLEQPAADIGVLLKPIWESRPDLMMVSVHFVNEGAGAMVQFPSFAHAKNDQAYQSIGCDWLHENKNPLTGRPFLTQNQTARNCHPKGTWVSSREFNAMETPFCRDQALHPHVTRFFGPVVDDFFTKGAFSIDPEEDDDLFFWVMHIGRAIFDRYSGEFIGCVAVHVLINRWTELIVDTLAVQNYSSGALVNMKDGIVVAGGDWSWYESRTPVHVTDVKDVIGTPQFYEDLKAGIERSRREHANKKKKHKKKDGEKKGAPKEIIATAVVECTSGRVMSASALPGTDFIYVQAVTEEVFDVIDQLKYDIDQDVIYSTLVGLLIGGIGMVVLLTIVWIESLVVTRPLNWIQKISWSIVNHKDSKARQSLRIDDPEEVSTDGSNSADNKSDDMSVQSVSFSWLKWTPQTEISELVKEFKKMIRGFSGAGKASTVAKPTTHEIRNLLVWQSDFQRLYSMAKGTTTPSAGQQSARFSNLTQLSEGTLNHSVANLDVDSDSDSGDEAAPPAENEGTASSNKQAEDASSEVSDTNDCYRSQEMSRATDPDEPGVSAISGEDSSRASSTEYLFRSAKREPAGSPEKPLALPQPALNADKSGTTAATTISFVSHGPPSINGWKNQGRNLHPQHKKQHVHDTSEPCIPTDSPLYRWILILFVVPMIVTNAIIAITATRRIGVVLPRWIEDVEQASWRIQSESMSVSARFASIYAEAILATPVRDLFVMNRVAGWIFTDALDLEADGFVEVTSGSEECKEYESSCPWNSGDNWFKNAPCDCAWEEPSAEVCYAFDEVTPLEQRGTRWMQKLFYSGKRHDADEMTGTRVASSFPMVDTSAANTSWWDDLAQLPGAHKGSKSSGYETTYDRVRGLSALSIMIFPMYNAKTSLKYSGEHYLFGAFLGFEADGMFAGWDGCKHSSPYYPQFQSTEANQAFRLNASLCPESSWGYDARCRGWYVTGKELAQAENVTSLYIAPPYDFAGVPVEQKASSVTQAIVDPRSGEHIGQSLVDFLHFEVLNFLAQHEEDSFHFVITPTEDAFGSDTVFAHGLGSLNARATIGDMVLPYDDVNSTNRMRFDEIVDDMKQDNSCFQNFTRTTIETAEDGTVVAGEEMIWLAYNPVHVRALDAVQCDDYGRGLHVSQSMVYGIGLGRTKESLERPFIAFKEDAHEPLTRNVCVYLAMTILISLLATSVACRISVAVSRPIVNLLSVVRQINAGKIDEDIAPLFGGSREVNQVYTSFAKLYKIVRVSNGAFFSKNLHWACHFVRDALKLFTKIDDRKAIAIASGNLGSTLLAINCSRPREGRCSCLVVDSVCCVKEAFLHFERSVGSGTEDFQTAPDMFMKVEFAEQLADRLFNRGMYFLLSKEDPCAGDNFETQGLEDLMKVQALDLDVLEYWIHNGMLKQKTSILFDRLLRRLHGLCVLMENDISQDIWDPKSLAYDCHRLLTASWDQPGEPLFEEFTQIGRLQQLEGALINMQLQKHQETDAARIAMRMLVEDEFIDDGAFQHAADAVLQFTSQEVPSDLSWSLLSKASAQRDIRDMLKSCKQTCVRTQKCVYFCLELSEARHLSSPDLRHRLLSLYDSHCRDDDFFGLVASDGRNPFMSGNNIIQLDMECKQQRQGEQRRGIESALDALGQDPVWKSAPSAAKMLSSAGSVEFRFKAPPSCKALTTALEKVVASEASSIYDSYIVYVTDGPKRNWDWKVLQSLKSRIEEINAKRKGDIHLILLDLEEQPEAAPEAEHGKATTASACRSLCRVSRGSAYIRAPLSGLEEGFAALKSSLSNAYRGTACSNTLLSSITMEKF